MVDTAGIVPIYSPRPKIDCATRYQDLPDTSCWLSNSELCSIYMRKRVPRFCRISDFQFAKRLQIPALGMRTADRDSLRRLPSYHHSRYVPLNP